MSGAPLTVAILGGGTMGARIAVEYAAAGHAVRVTTSQRTSAGDLRGRLLIAGADAAALNRITREVKTATACVGVDLVVESLPEDLALKQRELRAAQAMAPGAILATNTSSLAVAEIAAALDDPTRLLATHYLNPPRAFRIVEVVPSAGTSEDVVRFVLDLLESLGKQPIRLTRDSPGFVINRLQFALLRESLALVDEGVVSPEELDAIVSFGIGRRWAILGPFATVAVGGEEVFGTIAQNLFPVLSRAQNPPQRIGRLSLTGNDLARIRTQRDRALTLGECEA